jgi:hypothetical protein
VLHPALEARFRRRVAIAHHRSSKLGRYLQAQQEIKQMLASQQSERANFFQTFAALQDTNNYLELNKLKR